MSDRQITRHPLTWPEGQSRTPRWMRQSSSKFRTSFAKARDQLLAELRRLGVEDDEDVILSTEIPTRLDGLPYANRAPTSDDPGVAVYWTARDGKPMAMACDNYDKVIGNLRGITLTLEAMRAIERHGGTDLMNKAFAGFQALPAEGQTGSSPWYVTLGFERAPGTFDTVKSKYRQMILDVKRSGNDSGVAHESEVQINLAMQAAREHFGCS